MIISMERRLNVSPITCLCCVAVYIPCEFMLAENLGIERTNMKYGFDCDHFVALSWSSLPMR